MTGVSPFPGRRDTFGTGWRTCTGFVLRVMRTFVFFCRSGFMANPFFAWWAWYLMVVGRGVGED